MRSTRSPAEAAAARMLCAALLVALLAAAGCGQKGSLYLPDEPAQGVEEEAPEEPANRV